ncbi:lysophospholipid acyltransferase family protein [Thiohalorhabdus sp. Cl-TMA]|uniref:Lysophospholipid acyltransferase family protein n=1 Tax=Thiohalorhabdus methylotrophus TaxID=3242694 RepID=A0ABV4TSW0_9GAMM
MLTAVRSILFYLGMGTLTPLFALPLLASRPLPFAVRESIARGWCLAVLAWLRFTCGLRHRVEGLENLPDHPAVILSKHQSAWETIAFRTLFPAHLSWVLKKDLFRIPFFGWSLLALEEIGIDRASGREALRQVEEKGTAHLRSGRWVVVFPEGTRVAVGETGKYAQGGARLAVAAGAPVVPVALNSGSFWGRESWRKRPGTITVRIGPAFDPEGYSAAGLNRAVRDWIEAQMPELEERPEPAREPVSPA